MQFFFSLVNVVVMQKTILEACVDARLYFINFPGVKINNSRSSHLIYQLYAARQEPKRKHPEVAASGDGEGTVADISRRQWAFRDRSAAINRHFEELDGRLNAAIQVVLDGKKAGIDFDAMIAQYFKRP